jgi:hypothetical protein
VDTSALETQAAELSARAEELAAQTEAQAARIDALEAAAGDGGGSEILSTVAQTEARLAESLAAIADRMAALESRPVTVEPAEPSASAAAVEDLQSALEAQRAEIAALSERAADAEARAAGEAARLLARAALMRVQTAVDSGSTFAPELSELEQVAPVSVPEPLREIAATGVPTMAALQDSFPDAARTALAAARAEVPESEEDGIAGFLRRQLNVRSTAPREGSDPDAVLSRAEAAVRAGDLDTALTELEAMPEAARTAMNDWLEAASARKAAQDAASDLADSLNSN